MPQQQNNTESAETDMLRQRPPKSNSVMQEWDKNMKKDLNKTRTAEYSRGESKRHRSGANKKLNSKLKSLEKVSKEAAHNLAQAEILLPEEAGFLEAEGMERTYKFTQADIVSNVDIASAQKSFELDLEEFGPYMLNYTRNGRWMLIGGRKGHVASFDWKTAKLGCELQLKETVRDVWYVFDMLT